MNKESIAMKLLRERCRLSEMGLNLREQDVALKHRLEGFVFACTRYAFCKRAKREAGHELD